MALIMFKIFISVLLLIKAINCLPIINDIKDIIMDGMAFPKSVFSAVDAMKHLNRFGYMEKMVANMSMSSPQMKSVLMDYQRFMGINETGTLDSSTMTMMNMPRCGVADNLQPNTNKNYKMTKKRFRRYSLQGSMWETRDLTWKVTQYSTKDNLRGKEREIDRIMEYALNEWSENCGLNFIHENGNKKAMIEIGFKTKDHKDGNPFDGPGRTLAHAFFPQFGGDTHFDDHEKWTIDGGRGVDLLSVAVHEFGHALGLGHSDNKDSLMYPTYAGKRTQLKSDDINGISMLYGKRERTDTSYLDNNEKKKPNVKSSAPDLCSDFQLDAADCNTKDECFFFRDDYIWRIKDDTGVYPGYPKKISDIFPGITGKVDTVFTDQSTGRTYITKKDKIWVFKEPMTKALKSNALIESVIKGIGSKYLDAATRWGFNGKVYLFKDDKYWKYEPEKVNYPISRRYPQSMNAWRGIPSRVDAAMFWPKTGKTYFFVGTQYYRFNDVSSAVDRANPSFPRDASKWWLKCNKGSLEDSNESRNEIDGNVSDETKVNESTDPSGQGFFKTVSTSFTRFASITTNFVKLLKF